MTVYDNVRRLLDTLGDDDFVDAVTQIDVILDDVEETMRRVRGIEGDVDGMMDNVDAKLVAVDGTIRRIEQKVEASFAVAFWVLGANRFLEDDLLWAGILGAVGLVFASSLLVTTYRKSLLKRVVDDLADAATDVAGSVALR